MSIDEKALDAAVAAYNCTIGDLQSDLPIMKAMCKRMIEAYEAAKAPVMGASAACATAADAAGSATRKDAGPEAPATQQPVRLGKRKSFEALSEKCPRCGDNLVHNNTGIECGAMQCDYHAGGDSYSQPTEREAAQPVGKSYEKTLREILPVMLRNFMDWARTPKPIWYKAEDFGSELSGRTEAIIQAVLHIRDTERESVSLNEAIDLLVNLRGWIEPDRYKQGSERYKNSMRASEEIREFLENARKS